MYRLHVNVECQLSLQVRGIRKKFAFTETWRYNTKLHDPSKKKVVLLE